jgi:hypothetical protein
LGRRLVAELLFSADASLSVEQPFDGEQDETLGWNIGDEVVAFPKPQNRRLVPAVILFCERGGVLVMSHNFFLLLKSLP